MERKILYRPAYFLGIICLGPGEGVPVESDPMAGISAGIAIETIETKAAGGSSRHWPDLILGQESFFQNVYRAPATVGKRMVAPVYPGDLHVLDQKNETLMVQSGAYGASRMGIDLDPQWGGAKTFFASEGMGGVENRIPCPDVHFVGSILNRRRIRR